MQPVVETRASASRRAPANDVQAEAAVLAACLLQKEAIDVVRGVLLPEHFYADAHRRILEAIYALDDANTCVDLVTVASRLRDTNRLEQVGGTSYLAQLSDATPAIANVEQHAKAVRDLWRVRQAVALHQTKIAEGNAGDIGPVDQWLEKTELAIAQISDLAHDKELEAVGDVYQRYLSNLQDARARGVSIVGTPTGFADLDKTTGGLFNGDLVVVAGRPGLGKTSLGTSLAANVAKAGDGVAIWSLEMPCEQIAMRLACAEQKLDANRVRRNTLDANEWSRLIEAAKILGDLPIWIDDTPAVTVSELRSKLRRLQRMVESGRVRPAPKSGKIGLVIVDYLQLMKGVRERGDTREREVASLSQGLKETAKRFNVPIVALSQLNRSVEKKGSKDKRPQLSDLRESGAIENDADAVWLLYRESYYDRAAGPEVELDVAKQRNGPTEIVRLHFERTSMRYYAVADEYDLGSAFDPRTGERDDELDRL